MDAFNRKHHGLHKVNRLYILRLICVAILSLAAALTASAEDKAKIAVLPVLIEVQGTPENLAASLHETIVSGISEKGYQVISSDSINQHPLSSKQYLEDGDLKSIGHDVGADWVVSAALTKANSEDQHILLVIRLTGVTSEKEPDTISLAGSNLDLLPILAKNAVEHLVNKISSMPIISIQVKGNKRIEGDAILAIIDTKKGDIFDQAALNQDLRTIMKMGYFKDVQIETEDDPKGKIVTINVVELPFITQIKFEGNKEYKEDKLTGEIGIKKFAVLNMSEVQQSINKLKEYYKKNGYYNATITTKVDDLPNNEAVLTYVISEGKKVYITKIEFIGNEIFKDKVLIDLMKTNTKGFFYWLTSSGVFERAKLDYDVQTITNFYRNQGYVDARLGEPEVVYNEKKGLTISITITEGNRYKVGKVTFEGDVIKPEKELLAKVNIAKQEYISIEVLYDDVKILKNIYADDGYAFTDVNWRDATRKVNDIYYKDIAFYIDKKKKVRIERIDIKGNTKTRDKVIRRELKLVEGEYFSGTKLERSKENLNRLEYLESPEIKTQEGSSDNLMTLDVNVAEKSRGQFTAGAGYSDFDKFFATVGVEIYNLFGRGQSLSLDASLGSRITQYNMRFTEPWLFDKSVSGTINVYDWNTDYTDFTKKSKGGSVGVGFLVGLDDYTRASVSYSYDNAMVSTSISSSSLVLQDMIGKNVTSSITTGIGRDSRDQYFITSKGSVNSLSMEYAGGVIGGTAAFNKYNAVSAWYFPVWWNNVLLVRGSAGIVQKRGGGDLPIYQKFMLGGIDSIRGYDSLSISPKDPATGESIGGEKMWLGNIEYRVPIMKKEGVLGILFFDAGNAFKKDESWRLRAKRSVGFGIRWRSPMGDLRLEYGIKLDKDPGQDSGSFEFSMGGSF